jgi:hypothetical protein
METFKEQVREAAYKSMCKVNPGAIEALKKVMRMGQTAKGLEMLLSRKYGNGNLTSNSTILAAYHIESHPEVLEAAS